jgi:hypothetical protein
MRRKIYQHMLVGRMAAASLALALAFYLLIASPALAQSPSEYFNINYEPVTFDKSEVNAGEVFHAAIKGHAECGKTLPLPVSEATLTSQVIAENPANGTRLTLNTSYVISIKPFPYKKGETFEINQSIPLQFPDGTEPGEYRIIGKFTEVKAKILFLWRDFTSNFPEEQEMGTVKCIVPEPAPAPVPPPKEITVETQPPPAAPPTTSPTPPATPPEAPLPAVNLAPEKPEPFMPWWAGLLALAAVIAAVFGIVWLRRHRKIYQ